MSPAGRRCRARTRKGDRCRNPAGPDGLCAVHRRRVESGAAPTTGRRARPGTRAPDPGTRGPDPGTRERDAEPFAAFLDWAEEAIEFLGRRVLGEYEVDEFGHDPDLVEHVLAPLLRPLYRHWWRVETRGLEHVPDSGPALVVGNHAGTLPFDALMVALALLDEHPAHRSLRMLAADLAFDLPVIAPLARKSGNTLACAEDATRLLEAGELVGVWPEGYKGLGKPYRERYQLQRFGRGGFVEVA
ncbi:MAG: 1-acyl-sn-glycerol-3-phosphate acyltransferase, partial [Actinomycetes bacterium]